jgi:predicted nuclease of predicted toxin-antitoxin system
MRFVVDAHLPPGLCDLLQAAGHDALHTRQLSDQNRTTDEALNTQQPLHDNHSIFQAPEIIL